MVDRELLSAISDMMDEKLDRRFGTFEQKMDEKLDRRFGTFEQKMDEKLEQRLGTFEQKMDAKFDEKLKPIYSQLKDMNSRLKKLELTTENVIIPRLQNIEACYVSTFERYKQYCDRMEETFKDVDMLKKTVQAHSVKLQMIS